MVEEEVLEGWNASVGVEEVETSMSGAAKHIYLSPPPQLMIIIIVRIFMRISLFRDRKYSTAMC